MIRVVLVKKLNIYSSLLYFFFNLRLTLEQNTHTQKVKKKHLSICSINDIGQEARPF